jgi:peptidoglycan/xylan/chitin deacetylase (PgdA/CDA1 family)
MRLFRPGLLARFLYPEAVFRIKGPEKLLYLTFDDGPDPESTPRLLKILDAANVRAAFFFSGLKVEKHPGLIDIVRKSGHIAGNHGYLHLDGLISPTEKYISNVKKAEDSTSSVFFRPPYGRLRPRQYRALKEKYRIILWDLMPYDFDTSFGARNTLRIMKRKCRPGSVIVLHDTPSSSACQILEEFIKYARTQGYDFGQLQ